MESDLKTILYNKDIEKLMDYYPKESDSFELHFLSMFFKQFLSKNRNIDNDSFLSDFSKSFTEFVYLNSDTDVLFYDDSIFHLFPSCYTHSEKKYGTILSCERYDHDKSDLVQKEIYKRLNKFRRFILTETKTKSNIITQELIQLIWDKKPRNYDQLYPLVKNIEGIFNRYSKKTKLNYFETILKIISDAICKDFDKWTLYWERGEQCADPDITKIHHHAHYNEFHFNDWLHHYGQSKLVEGEYVMPLNSFGHKIAGYINLLKEINEKLVCSSCQGKITPDWNYGHKSFGSYRVTVFKCYEANCDLKNKGIYINRCTGCITIIDSREVSKKCRNKRYLCKNCHACCKPSHKEEHLAGSCPRCLEATLVVYFSNDRNRTKVDCYNCNFSISNRALNDNEFYERFFYLRFDETSSLAIENKKDLNK